MEILIATRNGHLIRELKEMLRTLEEVELLTLLAFPEYTPPPTQGMTLQSASILRAEHAASTLGYWTLADVSGLTIPALAKDANSTDPLPIEEEAQETVHPQMILSMMRELSGFQRAAYLECSLSLAAPEGMKKSVSAICEGTVTNEERGHNGFAYDSLFLKYEYDKTFAELDSATKNRISHRRKAFDKVALALETTPTHAAID